MDAINDSALDFGSILQGPEQPLHERPSTMKIYHVDHTYVVPHNLGTTLRIIMRMIKRPFRNEKVFSQLKSEVRKKPPGKKRLL